jgi:hypothetical protein
VQKLATSSDPQRSGLDLFRKAWEFGLEGLASKHRDRQYRAGTSPNLDQGQEPEASHRRVMKGIRMTSDHHLGATSVPVNAQGVLLKP